jgi:hypothetical protein
MVASGAIANVAEVGAPFVRRSLVPWHVVNLRGRVSRRVVAAFPGGIVLAAGTRVIVA